MSAGRETGRQLLLGAVACLLGFVVLALIVMQGYFEALDRVAFTLTHGSGGSLAQPFMEAASFLGGASGQAAAIVLASAMLWSRRRRWAYALPVVMAGAGLLQLLAKWGFDRPRPNQDAWGFPSAHVLTLVVLLGYLAYVVGASAAGRRRGYGVGGGVAVVAGVAYSRMYLEAHWLSDVLGGLTAGLAYLLLVIWLIRSLPALGLAAPAEPSTLESAFLDGSLVDPLGSAPDPVTAPGVATG